MSLQEHLKIFGTIVNIQRYFWWLEIHTFIKSYIQRYALCQQIKVNTHLSVPPLISIKADSYTYLFSIVTIDFINDLPESNRYNTLYIVVDHNLTKAIVFILYTKIINTIGN